MTIDTWIKLAFAIISAVLTIAVVPWLRQKTNAAELADLIEHIRIAVQAAEQSVNGTGMEKKAFVRNWLKDRGVNFEDGEVWNMVDAMIESAVLELKREATP